MMKLVIKFFSIVRYDLIVHFVVLRPLVAIETFEKLFLFRTVRL